MNEQITKLCSIANELDKKGHYKFASRLDAIVAMLTKEAWKAPADLESEHATAMNELTGALRKLHSIALSAAMHKELPREAKGAAKKYARFVDKQMKVWDAQKGSFSQALAAQPMVQEPTDASAIAEHFDALPPAAPEENGMLPLGV